MESVRKILAAPAFEDERKTRSAELLNTILLAMLSVMSLVVVGAILGQEHVQIIIVVLVFTLLLLGLAVLLRSGFVRLVSVALIAAFTIVLTFVLYLSGTARVPAVSGYFLITMIAGLTIGRQGAFWSTGVSILVVIGLIIAELSGILPPPDFSMSSAVGTQQVMVFSAMIIMSTVLLSQAVSRIRASLKLAEENQEELAMLNEELEQRIAVATHGLEERSAYLEGAAEISRAVTSILDTDDLVRQVVTLIQEQFDLYYVGLFMVDDRNEWAILQAGTGEAGRKMVAEDHRIRVGEGMIGWSIANAEARIALDVGDDAVRFENPDLPETRSEAALPLRSRGRVLGALTVQSAEEAAFDDDSITTLQTMADQVAVALDNAGLFARSEAAFEAERRAYGELSQEAWRALTRSGAIVSHFIADAPGTARPVYAVGTTALQDGKRSGPVYAVGTTALQDGKRSGDGGGTAHGDSLQDQRSITPLRAADQIIQDDGLTAVIPIKSRGKVLGGIRLSRSEDSGEWTEEQLALVQTVSEQLSTSLESARLYQDTQRRAAREQALSEMTTRFSRSLDTDTVLQTAVRELGRLLEMDEISVYVGNPEEDV